MPKFENVAVIKKANVYFDGKVTSRTIELPDGSKKTLGVILPGEYTFNTADKEIMFIEDGLCRVRQKGEEAWKDYKGGESFEVPANSAFTIKAEGIVDYCCSFIK
ncbi:MAG: pyrimidine/purine nucleoside phosphorylase [Nitrospirota bacterium]|nr:pyrimidine/purine nucleoside phosphorylase [Nitrospirota bacterium]